jgi:hypothetical protein
MTRRPTLLALLLLVGPCDTSAFGQSYKVLPLKGSQEAREARAKEARERLQSTARPSAAASRTQVSVELLTGRLGGGLRAQEWAGVFEQIGFDGRVRQERATDKLGVFETEQGPLRTIRVVGRLEPNGTALFADRRIDPADAAKLREWLTELQTYGAQGSPAGQPFWGLSRAQFDAVRLELSKPTEGNFVGQPFIASLPGFETPRTLPLRIGEAARGELAKLGRTATIRVATDGLSLGTTLALVLRDRGFGFRPNRTPEGTIELVVEPLARTADVWPVGWELEVPQGEALPRMFEFVPVRLEDSKLTDVLDVIAARTEVPILLDRTGIARAGIDVEALRASHPSKQTTWSLLLRTVVGRHGLTREFRVDEAGTPFCWVTVFERRAVEAD